MFSYSHTYKKAANRVVAFMLAAAFVLVSASTVALADINVTDVDVNGSNSTTVAPSASVNVSVTVQRDEDGFNGAADNDWRSTSYNVEGDGILGDTCVNTADHSDNGTDTESFSVTAPGSAGTYDLTVKVYRSSGCSGPTLDDTDTLNNAITVEAVTHTITASAGAGGSISPSGAVSVDDTDDKTFTITPSSTYIVSDVLVDGGSVGMLNSYIFTTVILDHTIAASFIGGWSAPTDTDNDDGVSNENNAFISNDSRAGFDSSDDNVEYDDFGLTIPEGAIIEGIEVAVEGHRTSGRTLDVSLTWNEGSNYTSVKNVGSTFTGTDRTVIAGSASDTWGRSWTASEFTNSAFKVKLDATSGGGNINVDQIQVKVTYSIPEPEPTTGNIEITKYVCPEETVVVRSVNGVGGTVPEGCVLQEGATFGYVHGEQTDANAPYPELSGPFVAAGATNGSGILTISDLPSAGRYLVAETNESNEQLPSGDILGLYCVGDGDTSDNNDNQELTFVPAGGSVSCVAYNKATAPVATVTTNPATSITLTDATLNGTNGPTAASNHSFWVSTSTFSTAVPNMPAGVYSTPVLGAVTAGEALDAQLSLVTTDGIITDGVPGNMPAITPNTTYYFAAWVEIGGTWYPGEVLSFTTDQEETPDFVKVTILKYLDDEMATVENASSTSFAMEASWDAENIGAGSGAYALDADGFNGNPTAYQAITSDMTYGADYSTNEVLDGNIVADACAEGVEYEHVGYKIGDSLSEAEDADIVEDVNLTNITSDKFVIVVNHYCNAPYEPSTVTVKIKKYIDGVIATAESSLGVVFGMQSSWSDVPGAGAGTYSLSESNGFTAETSAMQMGTADYTTNETFDINTAVTCDGVSKFALSGYSYGDSFAEAQGAATSTSAPTFTDLMTSKSVIVWNDTCNYPVVSTPVHLSPAHNSTLTTAALTEIDWTDSTSTNALPVTYVYQSANDPTTNPDGSFVSPVYTSGVLSSSSIPTAGTPPGVYYWHVMATDGTDSSPWTDAWKVTVDNSDDEGEGEGEETSSTIVVTPSNMQSWAFFTEAGTATGTLVFGPSTAPLGDGSANFLFSTGSDSEFFALLGGYASTTLSSIETLAYSTYRTSGGDALATALQLDIDTDLTDENNAWQGRLVYEPYHTQTVTTGVWQEWNT
ncbi:MAG: hypothetical protein WC761_05920, partial [Candidatus Paceibacterota bacterium]